MTNPDTLKANPKGQRQNGGRKPGVPNQTTQMLKDALLLAAEQVGEIPVRRKPKP